MQVAIDDEKSSDPTVSLEVANGYGDVIGVAEALRMVGESVVKPTAQVHCHPGVQSPLARKYSPAGPK